MLQKQFKSLLKNQKKTRQTVVEIKIATAIIPQSRDTGTYVKILSVIFIVSYAII